MAGVGRREAACGRLWGCGFAGTAVGGPGEGHQVAPEDMADYPSPAVT